MLHVIGFFANLISMILWIPQAKTTWLNRNNPEVLKGISFGTQILVAINTTLWCIYGLMIKSYWLAFGIVMILPLSILTIMLKIRVKENK